ncbi:MAG: DNA primase [Proteobacteria bacterium]|nr:DNA primase [Pseudomonadota bacterium]
MTILTRKLSSSSPVSSPMRFSPAFLDELRSRLRTSEILGKHMNVIAGGRGEFKALCPFHQEKTPSFTISDDKGFYHCFGCGKHGDIITFLIEKNGLSFSEAVTELAKEAGMPLPVVSEQDRVQFQKTSSIHQTLERATQWFEAQLQTEQAKAARDYLAGRGITEETIKHFRLGFAPDGRDAMIQALTARNITLQQLNEAGLVSIIENKSPYDRFRGRIIFPIMDGRGQVIAFGGRIMGDGQPKYLNSPETDVFKKGSVLYAWNWARERAFQKGNIVAVEGYMDVIALHKVGITNAVAPLGTAITEAHIQQLWKVANEPVICMDGDAAGLRAMKRAAELYLPLLKPGYSLKFAFLPAGQDPDDVIKNYGAKGMREILSNAKTLSQVIWDLELSEMKPTTPEQKAALESKLMKLSESIKDKTIRDHYRSFFNNQLWEIKRSTPAKKDTKPWDKKRVTHIEHVFLKPDDPRGRYACILVKLALNHPYLLKEPDIEEAFAHLETPAEIRPLHDALLDAAAELENPTADEIKERIPASASETLVKNPALKTYAKPEITPAIAKAEWDYISSSYNLLLLDEEYKEAAENSASNATEENWEHVRALQKQIEQLKAVVQKHRMHHELLSE